MAVSVIEAGCDFVVIGRAGILRHDFPEQVRRDPGYDSPAQPIPVQHLLDQGVGHEFIAYLRTFPGLVAEEETQA